MSMYDGFLPKEQKNGKIGYYPVTSAQEWEELPEVYKSMEWFPIEVYNDSHNMREKTVVEYVEFEVVYMTPYKVRGTFRVHRQEIQKILFCSFPGHHDCQLYSICGVVFQNGVHWGAKWHQDSQTGAYEVLACGHRVGTQGGFFGFVPNNIERTEDGGWKCNWNQSGNITHYEISNPFEHL